MGLKIKEQTKDIREKNEQLREYTLKLIDSERMKNILTGAIVHDIKNHIFTIAGDIRNIVKNTELHIRTGNKMRNISDTCTDIFDLASNLIDIGNMEEGILVLRKIALDAARINTSIDKFSQHEEFIEKNIVIKKPFIKNEYAIYADPYLFERVLQNLFSNAAKYVPVHGEIHLCFLQDEQENTLVMFNAGTPIPDAFKENIFDKYTTLEKTYTTYSKGLGLFFCKMVMNEHQGRIWVDTDAKGNYFNLAFPRQ